MKYKKPFKLRFNFKLRKLIYPVVSETGCSYGFILRNPKNEMTYSTLYNTKGDVILDEEFSILEKLGEFLFVIIRSKRKSLYEDYYELKTIDLSAGRLKGTFPVNSEMPMHEISTDKYVIFVDSKDDANQYIIFDQEGNLISTSASYYKMLCNEKLLYQSEFGTYIETKFFTNVYEAIALTSKAYEPMLLCGTAIHGELLFQAVGTKGHSPYNAYFKTYSEEKDGIVVKLCDKEGKDQKELAFFERETGVMHKFKGVENLLKFTDGSVLAVMEKEPDEEPEVCLMTYNGDVIKTFRKVFWDFLEIDYGVFPRKLAAVKELNGDVVFVDVKGRTFPMQKGEINSLDEWDNAAYTMRGYVNPMR